MKKIVKNDVRKNIIGTICGSPDRPLKIGNLEIPCYVLEDERRVLVQSSMMRSLGMSPGGSGSSGGDRFAKFASGKALKPFISNEIIERTTNPIQFRTAYGKIAYGYEATILADICVAILAAREAGELQKQQLHIARQAEILVRAFARVGIIALVDEVTGYQEVRARNALHLIFEKFIAKELLPWVKIFPIDFYKEIFRLHNWPFTEETIKKRPGVIGIWTKDIVYERLAPGVHEELQRIANRDEKGHLKHRLHQRLTDDVGRQKLKEHLAAVIALMKASTSWRKFMGMLNIVFQKFGETKLIPFKESTENVKNIFVHPLDNA